jgi:hypothetical protein
MSRPMSVSLAVTKYQGLICLLDFFKFSVGILQKLLLSKCEFCKNPHNDRHTLLWGINVFIPIVSTFCDWFDENLVERNST